jgi:hypothetical protein
MAADGDSRDIAEATQAVRGVGLLCELEHFERAAQVHVQARLGRLAVERGSDVDDRLRLLGQALIGGVVQAELGIGDVAEIKVDALVDVRTELGKVHVQLQRAPQALARLQRMLRAHEQGQSIAMVT